MRIGLCNLWFAALFAILAGAGIAEGVTGERPSVVPIPSAEQGLPTVFAEQYATICNNRETLEGAVFDKNGDLLFCDVSGKRVLRISPDKALFTVIEFRDFAPCGLAFHKDGRLFIVAVNLDKKAGQILALDQDGVTTGIILPAEAGYLPNDLVFDSSGGFYFSDFRGSATRPEGGVYHMSPAFDHITPVIPDMSQGNGVALSPDGKTLWATEYARNLLHRVNLDGTAPVPLVGSKIPYHFIGAAPDSMRVDTEGNVYVAMVGQGKVMIFNPAGIPIGQVLLPERDKGNNLRSTSLALNPQRSEMLIVAGNTVDAPSPAAGIFAAPALARGMVPPHGQKDK